ncbi:MAG: linear amide C-N hydrolase [Pseudomonadota bacterium]
MKTYLILLSLLLCVTSVLSQRAHSCTAFYISKGGQKIVGRNFDWHFDHGLVMANKRHVAKTALVMPNEIPAQWTSKYGNVTFNQYGREFPVGGMNEKGLMVEVLWLDSAILPEQSGKPALNEVQWVQYQLDNFATVKEVITHLPDLRIAKVLANLHYFVCDRTDQCVTIEPIDGKMFIHTEKDLPVSCLANNPYDESLAYATPYLSLTNSSAWPTSPTSLNRFTCAACMANNLSSDQIRTNAVNETYNILQAVSQGDFTKWSVVYDMANSKIYFKTQPIKTIKIIDLNALNFDCAQAVKIIDINTAQPGDITAKMTDYTIEANRRNVELGLVNQGLGNLPQELIELMIKYPDSTKCQ